MPESTTVNMPPSSQNTAAPNKGGADGNDMSSLFSWIQINVDYFKTTPGIVKILEVLIGIVCICLASPAKTPATQWFLFIVIISLIATVIWVFVYLLSVKEALTFPINWPLSELLNAALIAIMYLVMSVIQISTWMASHYVQYRVLNIISGMFGVCNTLIYFFGAYLAYDEWKHTHTIRWEWTKLSANWQIAITKKQQIERERHVDFISEF